MLFMGGCNTFFQKTLHYQYSMTSAADIKELFQTTSLNLIWKCIRYTIESLQFFSVFFSSTFHWNTNILNAFDGLSNIRMDVTGDSYMIMFYTFCSIITFYISFTVVTIFACDGDLIACEGCEEIDEFLWFFIGDGILFGLLFIPISSILLEIFHCQSFVCSISDMCFLHKIFYDAKIRWIFVQK